MNPSFLGLDDAMGEAIGRLIDQRVDEENYAAARGHMRQLEALFPGKTVEAVARRKVEFAAQSAKLLAEANLFVERGDYSQARRLAGHALVIWPSDESRGFIKKIHERYPRVVVGVTSYYNGQSHNRFDSADLRISTAQAPSTSSTCTATACASTSTSPETVGASRRS